LCGYSLNDELLQFMNLTEELKIGWGEWLMSFTLFFY
jgi:hypothetical protein